MDPLNGPTSKGSDVEFGQLFGVMFFQCFFKLCFYSHPFSLFTCPKLKLPSTVAAIPSHCFHWNDSLSKDSPFPITP